MFIHYLYFMKLLNNNGLLSNSKVSEVIIEPTVGEQPKLIVTEPNIDPVREYDYSKLYDILEEPTRRVPRHEIHPSILRQYIDIPSRGYPDNFTQYGILIASSGHDKHSKNDKSNSDKIEMHTDSNNRIIRLFGRQEYPGSNRYEYYTMINSGYDAIKIPLDVRKRELYDDDKVYVKELGQHYKVQLHNYDAPKYYPDI